MSFEPQLNEKERRFLTRWRRTRQQKWRWIARCGVFWGLFVSTTSYFFDIWLGTEDFDALSFVVQLIVFTLGGVILTYWLFRAQDKRFQQVYPDVDE